MVYEFKNRSLFIYKSPKSYYRIRWPLGIIYGNSIGFLANSMRIRPFLQIGDHIMLAQHLFYLERAAEARAIARAATLDNVRDRWLLSETSWTEMAARSKRNEKMRAKLIADKATERAALKTARESVDDA